MPKHQISTKSHTETSIVVDTQTETVENGHWQDLNLTIFLQCRILNEIFKFFLFLSEEW